MKHKASRELFAYWNKQRGARLAPNRNEIDPGAIRGVLGDSFMVSREARRETTFRLAGTRICDMFGRELKGVPFLSLWDARSHGELRVLLDQLAEETTGVVAGVTGETDEGEPISLEMLLLPLYSSATTEARSIGTLAPMAGAVQMNLQSVSGLSLHGWRLVGPQLEAAMLPRFVDLPPAGIVRSGMVVHSGGRS